MYIFQDNVIDHNLNEPLSTCDDSIRKVYRILLRIVFIFFVYTFYIHSIYIPYTLKVKMKVKKWRPEKLKMVKKHFFSEMFGDLWGVICYHHWYPRAGLEGQKENIFFKKHFEV